MEEEVEGIRLVSFLGKANYQQTTYAWGDGAEDRYMSRYATAAVCQMLTKEETPPQEVCIVSTDEAWGMHGGALSQEVAAITGVRPTHRPIPYGETQEQLWDQFATLRDAFRVPSGRSLVLDITNGFRSQPFFAAAALSFVRAVDPERPEVRVYYAGNLVPEKPTAIWDLTPFTELVDWAQALALFLKTGRVADVVNPTERLGRALRKAWARGGMQGPQPQLDRLAAALKAFGEDLATIRTGALLLGRQGESSSVDALVRALQDAEPDVRRHLPPLADVVQRIRDFLEPLTGVTSLRDRRGEEALASLAGLYLDMQRYSEAATTVREAWVTRYASPEAATPGPGHSRQARNLAEIACARMDRDTFRRISDMRNDIDHGGMNPSPAPARTLIGMVSREVEALRRSVGQTRGAEAQGTPVFLNLSNHASERWEDTQREAALALAPRIVDLAFPEVPPDASEDDVKKMAEDLLEKVPEGTSHAMVQGEFTLTWFLVHGLNRRGIQCLAATSRRDVVTGEGGVKTVRFRFVRFRSYSLV